MKVKKILSGLLSVTILASSLLTNFGMKVNAAEAAPAAVTTPAYVGNVKMSGDASFDSDSIMNSDDSQWRWLSYPESRIVVNPGSRPKYDGGMSLNLGVFANGIQDAKNVQKIQMGDTASGTANDWTSLSTVWYPYKLTAQAVYGTSTVNMSEYFADKNTFVRLMDVSGATGQTMTMSDPVSNQTINDDGSMLVHSNGYYLLYKVLVLNNDGTLNSIVPITVSNGTWTAKIPFTGATTKVAFTLTIATDADGAQVATDRSKTVSDGNLVTALANTKTFWDGKLRKVPAPTVWGIQGGLASKGVTPEQHRRSFYAAWAFNYQNIIEPTPETNYPYYQITLGKPSMYTAGPKGAPNSCSWESFYDIQQMALVEPDIAWSAVEGFINSIEDSGKLSGESLPSQKAHTVWVCYENKKDDAKLAALYPKIKSYLQWRFNNPHWGIGGRVYNDEKDISFVMQWYSDVSYAIKMCQALGKYDDIAMWENLKKEMGENSRKWFFTPAAGDAPDKIYNFYFTDSGLHYEYDRQADVPNYIASALYADFPSDLTQKVIDYYIKLHDSSKDLVGFDFYKYGDGCHIAYALLERASQDPRLAGMWQEYTNAAIRSVVKTVEFCEESRPDKYEPQGVQPSTFTASTVVDFTYMNNGMRIDLGAPVAIANGQTGIKASTDSNITVYTLKGSKPVLPKTVKAEDSTGTPLDVSVAWDSIDESKYMQEGSFDVSGKLADTGITVTATVKVYGGELTFDAINPRILTGNVPSLPSTLIGTYVADSKTQTVIVPVTWENVTADKFSETGTVNVDGSVNFNGQKINAAVEVFDMPVIESESGKYVVDQNQTLKLAVKDFNVTWSIKDSGTDDAAGINADGTLLAVKPGKVTVVAKIPELQGQIEREIAILPKNVASFANGGTATASDQADSARGAAQAIDEDSLTMWRSNNTLQSQWFQVDLKKNLPISGVKIRWFEGNQPKSYNIAISDDGSQWQTAYTVTSSPDTGKNDYSAILVFDALKQARYIRINVTGYSNFAPGIIDFQVFANPEITKSVEAIDLTSATGNFAITEKGINLQLNAAVTPADATDNRVEWKVTNLDGSVTTVANISSTGALTPLRDGKVRVTAISVDGAAVSKYVDVDISNQTSVNLSLNKTATAGTNSDQAKLAIDGDRATRWGSSSGAPQAQPFTIDLGDQYTISTVALYCDSGAYPVNFKLQYSNNNTDWTDITSVTGNTNPNRTFVFAPVDARYVRTMSSTTTNGEWSYSIWEFEVYGISKTALTPPTDLTVATDAGTAPVLPATVDCKNGSGDTVSAAVTWKTIPSSEYAIAGTFVAQGNLTDGTPVYTVVNVTPALYFNLNGVDGQAPEKINMNIGQPVGALPTPNMEGNEFLSWNTQANGKGETYSDTTVYNSYISTTLYAIWKAQPINLDITSVVSPSSAQISGTDITANVANGTTEQTVGVSVGANASWKLYSDSACTTEIGNKTMALAVGANTAYIKVTGTDNTSKVYTITVTRASAGGDNTNPGGNTSSGGGTTTTTDVSGSTVTPEATAANNVTTSKPSDASIKKALENAQNAANTTGNAPEVVINVPAKSNTDTVSVTVPKTTLDTIAKSADTQLTLKAGEVILSFSDKAIDTINSKAQGDIEFTVGKADVSKLTDAQKAKVNDRPVYTLTVSSNGTVHTNFEGNVNVTFPYTLKAGENPNTIVIYYVDANGNMQVVENSVYDSATGKIKFTTGHFSVYMIGSNPVAFNDVKTHWGKPAIEFAAARGLVEGVGKGLYQPDRKITRAEFVQMMQNVLKLPKSTGTEQYADVSKSVWYYNAIMSAKTAGLLKGIDVTGKNFKPNQAITREEMAVILANTAAYKKIAIPSGGLDFSKKYKDYGVIRNDYRDELQVVVKLGLMGGMSEDTFGPKGTATRAQAAQVQMNLLQQLN